MIPPANAMRQLRREPMTIADAIATAVETSRPLMDLQRQQLPVRGFARRSTGNRP